MAKQKRPGVASMNQTHTSDGIGPGMHDVVIKDLQERKQVGLTRYGRMLKAHNGRDPLVDSYQEKLDDIVYTRQAMIEWNAMKRRIRKLEIALEKIEAGSQFKIGDDETSARGRLSAICGLTRQALRRGR